MSVKRRRAITKYSAVLVLVAVAVGPLLWMMISSIRLDTETFAYPPPLLPRNPTTENFVQLAQREEFVRYFVNSAIAATVTTLIVVPIAVAAAYSIARMSRHLGRIGRFAEHASLLAYMVPAILLAVPTARIVGTIGLGDSLVGLIAVYVAHLFPLGLWLLRSYILGVSTELEAAAMVDGATKFQTIRLVVVPQILPGIIATAIFTFNAAWSEYLFASVLLFSGEQLTVTAGIALLIGQAAVFSWGELMAAGVAVAVPVILLSMILQRHLVAGWGSAGVKG